MAEGVLFFFLSGSEGGSRRERQRSQRIAQRSFGGRTSSASIRALLRLVVVVVVLLSGFLSLRLRHGRQGHLRFHRARGRRCFRAESRRVGRHGGVFGGRQERRPRRPAFSSTAAQLIRCSALLSSRDFSRTIQKNTRGGGRKHASHMSCHGDTPPYRVQRDPSRLDRARAGHSHLPPPLPLLTESQ